MFHNVHSIYVSHKISKIRWCPDVFNKSKFFITGSVDNDVNNLELWNYHESDDDIYPFLVASAQFEGDVTEIQFINADCCVASSSIGSVELCKICPNFNSEMCISMEGTWESIHNGPCTALAVNNNDIATVGEDGAINLLTAESQSIVRTIGKADNSSINCVTFLKHNEILTSNLRGQMKIWDLGSNKDIPISTFAFTGDQVIPTCFTYHPTQRHLVVAGDNLGALTTWDLRQNTYPVNIINAHEGSISEIQFHSEHPNQLFSCSAAGEIWHWSTIRKSSASLSMEVDDCLTLEDDKNKLEVFTLMPVLGKPINSLDLNDNTVICGCDNEAFYLINGINF